MKILIAVIIVVNFSVSISKAEEFPTFFKDFSTYCLDGIGSPIFYKAMAKSENWISLPEEKKALLGNATGSPFDGWAYEREKGNIFMIAFATGEYEGSLMHSCSLVNLNSNYKKNVELMIKRFKAVKFDEYHMGLQFVEMFKIRLPGFKNAIIITSQDQSQSQNNDMFKFDLAVFE